MPFAEKEPGVVDEDVEPAKPGHRRRDGGRPVLLAGHVEMHVDGGIPAPAIVRAVSRPRSSSTSPIATLAPASTISRAVAAPMPRAAPR